MINTKNKRLEITLTNEEMTLLNSLSERFNISKSNVIKQALKVFASKRSHYLTLSFREVNISEQPTKGAKIRSKEDNKITDDDWDKLFPNEPKKQNENDDETLPF